MAKVNNFFLVVMVNYTSIYSCAFFFLIIEETVYHDWIGKILWFLLNLIIFFSRAEALKVCQNMHLDSSDHDSSECKYGIIITTPLIYFCFPKALLFFHETWVEITYYFQLRNRLCSKGLFVSQLLGTRFYFLYGNEMVNGS